jgi:hypothetical protein
MIELVGCYCATYCSTPPGPSGRAYTPPSGARSPPSLRVRSRSGDAEQSLGPLGEQRLCPLSLPEEDDQVLVVGRLGVEGLLCAVDAPPAAPGDQSLEHRLDLGIARLRSSRVNALLLHVPSVSKLDALNSGGTPNSYASERLRQLCNPARRSRRSGYSPDFVLGSKSSEAELMQ